MDGVNGIFERMNVGGFGWKETLIAWFFVSEKEWSEKSEYMNSMDFEDDISQSGSLQRGIESHEKYSTGK